jgi:pyruvate kinase
VSGTKISDRKGVSLPDTDLPVGALTEKDRSDLDAVLATGVDWVALSFVQRPEDLAEVRKIARGRAALMSKIEKPQAVARLAEIIELSDALMVARGDLGVEMPLEAVPGIQKQITRAARRAGKPVVVATQMLESMISAPVPTRAEVSDVSIAVFEGADAIMLSAESAAGAYPVEAVATMDGSPRKVETRPALSGHHQRAALRTRGDRRRRHLAAARQIAETLKLSAIVTYTASGTTGLRAARERPQVPIIALSPFLETARRLSLVWGTHCVVTEDAERPRRHGRPRLPHRRPRRDFGKPRATASSSPPACRCARRARPTCCASPISASTVIRNAGITPQKTALFQQNRARGFAPELRKN